MIVADDASTDDTQEWLSVRHPSVRLVRLEKNQGFCAAVNAGIGAASGEFIQLLNNDAEVTEGWLEAGLNCFADATIGSVAPLVLVRSDPSRVDSAGDQYFAVGWPAKRGHGQSTARWINTPPTLVFGASGSSAFYRTSALRATGFFDLSFGSYYEDIDIAFRLRWAGYSCVFSPNCRVLHEVSASFDHARPDLQRKMSRNAELVFWSRLPLAWLIPMLVPHLAFVFAQALWRLARRRLRPFAVGKLDAFRLLSKELLDRRRLNRALAAQAKLPPRFPIAVAPILEILDHLRRPVEASAARPTRAFAGNLHSGSKRNRSVHRRQAEQLSS